MLKANDHITGVFNGITDSKSVFLLISLHHDRQLFLFYGM